MGCDADVIVVGGGPGGASAAYFLEQSGWRTLVLEQKTLPRDKTCAGGVPGSALKLFPFSFSEVIEQSVQQGTFVCGERRVTQSVPQGALHMVRRRDFDAFLLRQSGARVLDGEAAESVEQDADRVRITTRSGRRLSARYVVGADGPRSKVARCAGMNGRQELGLGLEVEVDPGPELLERYRGRFLVGLEVLGNGYTWIFPKAGYLSVGIGTMCRGEGRLQPRLKRVMDEQGIDVRGHPYRAHPLPVYRADAPRQKGRILLVGDAAGLVDPLTGEGIRHALESGKLAAEAVARGQVTAYSRWIQRSMGSNLWWSSQFSRIFYARQRKCFEWLIRNRLVFRDVMRIANSSLGYRTSLAKIPLYLLSWWRRAPLDG